MSTATVNDMKDFLVAEMKRFQAGLNGESASPLNTIRKEAFARFEQLGFPATRHEEWKYTNLTKVLSQPYQVAGAITVQADVIKQLPFAGVKANLVVLVNGFYSQEHSSVIDGPDAIGIYSIAQLRKEKSELLTNHFAKYAPYQDDAMAALNTAFLQDGLLIHVPKNAVVTHPVIIYHLADAETASVFIQPRTILLVEDFASVQITEAAVSLGQYHSLSNGVTEAHVGANARLDYYKLQNESEHASRIDYTRVVQERDATVNTLTITTSGGLVRNTLHFYLNDQNINTYLNGLYLAGKNSLVDNHTMVDHAMPHCYSNELYKGIVGSNGQAVFNGKVMVRKDAQKTNAYQRNANVLLSDEALVNTKPQLEIFADDVKCSHGATTGQIDEEALFYLRSRGIGVDMAKTLLMQAFSAEVLEMVTHEQIKAELGRLIEARIATL